MGHLNGPFEWAFWTRHLDGSLDWSKNVQKDVMDHCFVGRLNGPFGFVKLQMTFAPTQQLTVKPLHVSPSVSSASMSSSAPSGMLIKTVIGNPKLNSTGVSITDRSIFRRGGPDTSNSALMMALIENLQIAFNSNSMVPVKRGRTNDSNWAHVVDIERACRKRMR